MSEKNFTLPLSEYYSDAFPSLWNEMLSKYGFRDSTIERTVQNYGSTVKLICDHCRKDFLALDKNDMSAFFSYLDERAENGTLSRSTVLTYKKNLRSVGNYFERLMPEKDMEYKSPFSGQLQGTVSKRTDKAGTESLTEDFRRFISIVKEHEAPQYYHIFCMLAYFKYITPVKICEMKAEQIFTDGEHAEFRFLIQNKPVPSQESEFIFRLPEAEEREFVSFYGDYTARLDKRLSGNRVFAFYNRNYRPVNFKTLGTVFRNCNRLAGNSSLGSIRDICGILHNERYCISVRFPGI